VTRVTRGRVHEFGAFIHLYVIHSHLHGAKQVILHHGNMNGLMNHQYNGFAARGTVISQGGGDQVKVFDFPLCRVNACHIDFLVEEVND
jgi:hypothetical protein